MHDIILYYEKLSEYCGGYAFMKAHQTELEKKGEGSTNQKELKPLTLKEMLIAVPPISEQKRINKSINVAFSHLAIIEKCLN